MTVARDLSPTWLGTRQELVAWPVQATAQLYRGTVALVAGNGGGTAGYLRVADSPGSTDFVAGIVDFPAGGTALDTGSGIVGGAADGDVYVDVKTGTVLVQSGTGADALSATTNGKTVYYHGTNAAGPIADATAGSKPVFGIQLPQDPSLAAGAFPGSNYWPVKMNVIGGP